MAANTSLTRTNYVLYLLAKCTVEWQTSTVCKTRCRIPDILVSTVVVVESVVDPTIGCNVVLRALVDDSVDVMTDVGTDVPLVVDSDSLDV